MKIIYSFLLLLLSISASALAENVFVGPPSSSCSGTGTSWSTCINWTDVSFARGKTYYLMDGSYPGKLLNTTNSGITPIIIKKATLSDFGGGTLPAGVNVAGQVLFTSGFTIDTSYWILDGVKGSWSESPNDYGFRFIDGETDALFIQKYGALISNLTFSHFAAKAPSLDGDKPFLRVYTQVDQVNDVTLSHSLLDGYQAAMESNGQGSLNNENWVLERTVCLRGYSRDEVNNRHHGEWVNANGKKLKGLVVKYNLFKLADGGMSGTVFANNSDIENALVYGNVFDAVSVGNGIVAESSGGGKLMNSTICNNTFLNAAGNSRWVGGDQNRGSGNIAKNNLISGMYGTVGTGVSSDYNSYFNTTNTPNEPHGQVDSSVPFLNLTTYALSAQTSPADMTVPAECLKDRFGITGISRGAVQFQPNGVAPKAPSGVNVH